MLRFLLTIITLTALCFNSIAQDQEESEHLIKSIYFGGGSYYIDQEQTISVKEFVESIPNRENYIVTVHSHTDNIGGADYNEWLSEMRSNSAIGILKELGIEQELIDIQDFGQFNPVYDNSTWLGRLKNRRVDIIFWPVSL